MTDSISTQPNLRVQDLLKQLAEKAQPGLVQLCQHLKSHQCMASDDHLYIRKIVGRGAIEAPQRGSLARNDSVVSARALVYV